MTPTAPALFRTVRRYVGTFREMRDEFRMAHFMYSLPEEIRKDLGWPDRFTDTPARDR